jgi:hypothetical protein
MSEKLPYFKFFTGEWANGSITLENYSVQGVFINVCCFYWSKQGDCTKKQLEKKIRSKKELAVLFEEEIIKLEGEFVVIEFLDNQMIERDSLRAKASKAGKISAQKRAEKKQQESNGRSTDVEIEFNKIPTIKNKKRKEEEEKRKEKEELFENFWNMYDKKTSREKCFKKFLNLKEEEITALFKHVPKYVASTPDKKFRKDPTTYLNNKSFNDEIILSNGGQQRNNQNQPQKGFEARVPNGYNPEIF